MAKLPGSLWVEGETLNYVSSTGEEWAIQGDLLTVGPYTPGSLWLENDNSLHYVGVSGQEYWCPIQGIHTDAAAGIGSLWVEGNFLAYVTGDGVGSHNKIIIHRDIAHQDGGGSASHTDVPHQDSIHSDSHSDGSHGDTHTDNPHGDFHGDGHTDVPHTDAAHGDAHTDAHTDYHGDHSDLQTHWDCNLYNGFENPGDPPQSHQDHNDGAFPGTLHCDVSHQDKHSDEAHQDSSHGDSAHADDHNDQAHQDSSHVDSHTDSTHGDSHSDSPATNVPHGDHTDVTHLDVAHVDNPVSRGF